MDKWQQLLEQYMGEGVKLAPAVHPVHEGTWERRDILGVHPQKQAGLNWVGACVPAGRLLPKDFDEIARIAEVSRSVQILLWYDMTAVVALADARLRFESLACFCYLLP